jgi:hypothetical protein
MGHLLAARWRLEQCRTVFFRQVRGAVLARSGRIEGDRSEAHRAALS